MSKDDKCAKCLSWRLSIGSTDGLTKACGTILFALRKEADAEWIFIDGSYVRAHQHASGARRGEYCAIGTSRGGTTTKIHMAADAHGNPLCIEITGGVKSTTVKLRQL